MQEQKEILNIPIHDIKPLMEIQDYSLYYFLAVIGVATVVLLGLAYLVFNYLKKRNKFNIRAHNLELLHAISLNNPKDDAYKITLYGAIFQEDSQRHKSAYLALVENLESYKYKKSVEEFSDETRHLVDIYLSMLDV